MCWSLSDCLVLICIDCVCACVCMERACVMMRTSVCLVYPNQSVCLSALISAAEAGNEQADTAELRMPFTFHYTSLTHIHSHALTHTHSLTHSFKSLHTQQCIFYTLSFIHFIKLLTHRKMCVCVCV
jgi:hypothetical protein